MEQSCIAIMLWHTSILILTSTVFVFTSAIKFPGRKESILGKTYFGSAQLLNTEIDDVKPFIAEFTLPETGLEVTGTAPEIHEQFERYCDVNAAARLIDLTACMYVPAPAGLLEQQ